MPCICKELQRDFKEMLVVACVWFPRSTKEENISLLAIARLWVSLPDHHVPVTERTASCKNSRLLNGSCHLRQPFPQVTAVLFSHETVVICTVFS